ncbi:AraC family transcriptional regulator [Sinimarinibacterium sp. NLF-5-8]|uniref:AraC family transcriptional regulator n=1 Tax=Sinimarinibacterium sp. NLF-5-8 TaxID=2698684 RepID=UPI00137BE448|nr:AraC family transcriptional regulator [Sinimarinibacterium sp. NLF-5-8]QHS09319.1 AraC family transcriptional regulator [Sinimarinibacterium sp. NLF-5-8]
MAFLPDTLHPVAIARVMVNFAAGHGVDAETCLSDTGITAALLDDPEALIERQQELRLVENLMLALPQIPALGFELGLQYSIATFGIWGFALRISRSLREAIHLAIRYLPLSTAYCQFSVIEDAQYLRVVADPAPIPAHLRTFLLQRDTATAINLFHEMGLSGLRVHQLHYQGLEGAADAARIAQLCGITPQYHASANALLLRHAEADMPLPMYDPHLARLLEDQCRAQLEHRRVGGIVGQVRQLLLGPLGLIATLEEVAQHLAMAPRSLRRKLEAEGVQFRQLVEAERRQLALQLLQGTQMKLDELALHLGYGDTTSFTRAFRRWFDCAPGEYRKAHGAPTASIAAPGAGDAP